MIIPAKFANNALVTYVLMQNHFPSFQGIQYRPGLLVILDCTKHAPRSAGRNGAVSSWQVLSSGAG